MTPTEALAAELDRAFRFLDEPSEAARWLASLTAKLKEIREREE